MEAKLPKRFAGLLFSGLMALSMSIPMSAVMLLVNDGSSLGWAGFLTAWVRAAATGFAVALPIASFVSPRIRRLTDRLTGSGNHRA